jgi:hypothetical protein
MKATKQVLLFLAGLGVTISAEAVGPTATVAFYIEDRETHKQSPAKQAQLGQYVCMSIRAMLVPDGEHTLQLTIYDGAGKEIHKAISHVNASNQVLRRLSCYGTDEDYEAAGTWWFIVELDGEPLVSESIEVRAN